VAFATLSIASTHQKVHFSLDDIRGAGIHPPLVFINSRVSKMHDSIPLQLFSPNTLSLILQCGMANQLLMMPWCLLTSSLTLPTLSTRTRADLLEIRFWILYACRDLKDSRNKQWQIFDRPQTVRDLGLYTSAEVHDGLNTFVALVTHLQPSVVPICLNRLGSNPLGHAFGKARIRWRDVNSMRRMLGAMPTETMNSFAKSFLEILGSPCRRGSVGVDCEPWSESDASALTTDPRSIADAV
jgi:hypothetical protein